MASFRLTQRQSNIFLAVSVVTLAAVAGTAIGVMVPKLLAKSPPPSLVGFVMNAPVLAPNFTLRDQRGAMISLSSLRSNVIALTFLDTQCVQICPLAGKSPRPRAVGSWLACAFFSGCREHPSGGRYAV